MHHAVSSFLFLIIFCLFSRAQAQRSNAPAADKNYSTVYLYRLPFRAMRLNKYAVHVNDSIYAAANGSRKAIRIYQEGPLEIWAKSEGRRSLVIPVRFGNVYYVRCGIEAGIIKGKPVFTLMDPLTGKAEYSSIDEGLQ